jgi:diacylglycerol kinase family enzyme
MRHLFVINPKAAFLNVDDLVEDINYFFINCSVDEHYTIHINRWKRDAVGYIRRYVTRFPEIVRVYAMGGNGTLFEVINGVAGLPNVQVAFYPLGRQNSLLYTFGEEKEYLFRSLRNLVFSPVASIDAIQAGNNYSVTSCLIGGEAKAFAAGEKIAERIPLPRNLCYFGAGLWQFMFENTIQNYHVEIDGNNFDGGYVGLLITNIPGYGLGFKPAIEARINDGLLDLYLLKYVPRYLQYKVVMDYEHGNHAKWPAYIEHYQGREVSVSSESYMSIVLDGEFFYDVSMNLKIIPGAVDFVCPEGAGIETGGGSPS